MTDDENPIARVDLATWQPPPPRAVDTALLLGRMVAPATARPRRTRWIIATLAAANIALVASLLVVLGRDEPQPAVVLPAGGPDVSTREALRRLEQQQAQLTRQLADLDQLKATITSLSDRVRQCEQKTVPTPPGKPGPKPTTPSEIALSLEPVVEDTSPTAIPDALDRSSISNSVRLVRPALDHCGSALAASMPARVRVRVVVTPSGQPTSSVIANDLAPSVNECLVREMNKATFPRTKRGGTFSYPLTVGMELE